MKITILMVTLFTLVIVPVAYSQDFALPPIDGVQLPGYSNPPAQRALSQSQSRSQSDPNRVDLGICSVSVLEQVEVPARTSGALMELKIEKGERVKKHTLIASINNERAVVEKEHAREKKKLAEFQASSREALKLAQATLNNANDRLSKNQRLYDRGAVTAGERDESQLAAVEAQLAVSKALHDLDAAKRMAALETKSVESAEVHLQQHFINAPFDGDVMEVHKAAGEWVAEGEKVAKIVRMDKLQVQGSFYARDYNPSEMMGRQVVVTMAIARGQTAQFTGKISSVSLDQTANGSYRVFAQIENRRENGQWVLRPQAEVTMKAVMDGI